MLPHLLPLRAPCLILTDIEHSNLPQLQYEQMISKSGFVVHHHCMETIWQYEDISDIHLTMSE